MVAVRPLGLEECPTADRRRTPEGWRRGCQCKGDWCDFCRTTHVPHRAGVPIGGLCSICGHLCGHIGPHHFTTCEWRALALPIIELGFSPDFFADSAA